MMRGIQPVVIQAAVRFGPSALSKHVKNAGKEEKSDEIAGGKKEWIHGEKKAAQFSAGGFVKERIRELTSSSRRGAQHGILRGASWSP